MLEATVSLVTRPAPDAQEHCQQTARLVTTTLLSRLTELVDVTPTASSMPQQAAVTSATLLATLVEERLPATA